MRSTACRLAPPLLRLLRVCLRLCLLPWLLQLCLLRLLLLRLLLLLLGCRRLAIQVEASQLHRVGCRGVGHAHHPQAEAPRGRHPGRRGAAEVLPLVALREAQLVLLVDCHPAARLCRNSGDEGRVLSTCRRQEARCQAASNSTAMP